MPRTRQHANQADKQRAYRERQKQARIAEQQAKGFPVRPTLPTVPALPRWKALIESSREQIEIVRDEMQIYFDERSEKWQESEKGEEHQNRMESLESALSALDEIDMGNNKPYSP